MVRERIKELVDFARIESPYRSANKGWLTNDVYLQLGKSSSAQENDGAELADVSVYWKPISEIVILLFVVLCLSTIFVYMVLNLSLGKLQIPFSMSYVSSQSEEVSGQSLSAELSSTTEKMIVVEQPVEVKPVEVKPVEVKPVEVKNQSPEKTTNALQMSTVPKKVTTRPVTATDLFQSPRRGN